MAILRIWLTGMCEQRVIRHHHQAIWGEWKLTLFGGVCQTKGLVCEAKANTVGTDMEKTNIDSDSNTFNDRFNNHKAVLSHADKQSSTQLSKHAWEWKRADTASNVDWMMLHRANEYTTLNKQCDLCLRENSGAVHLDPDKEACPNSRTNFTSLCRRQKKPSLSNFLLSIWKPILHYSLEASLHLCLTLSAFP